MSPLAGSAALKQAYLKLQIASESIAIKLKHVILN